MKQATKTLGIDSSGRGLFEFTHELHAFVRDSGIRTRPHRREVVLHLSGD